MFITDSALFNNLPVSLRPPTSCPHCSTPLIIQDAWPFCPNFHCPYRVYGRLQKFVDVLDIKGAGENTLLQLATTGICHTPADLFNVTLEQFVALDRKGEKHYDKFRQGLEAARKMSTAQFFACLAVEGQGTWDNICAVPNLQTIDQILDAVDSNNPSLLAKAVRVSSDKAQSIIQEINDRRAEVDALRTKVQFKQAGTTLVGRVICITGTLNSAPRPKIEQMIKDAGGQVSSSCTSRTTHLVTNDPNSGSSKNNTARKLGIPIISEQQLLSMF
jgi:DNA ligase (NAD+)